MYHSWSVLHIPTHISLIPQLLHILTTSLVYLVYFLLWLALCFPPACPPPSLHSKAWASQNNTMLRQWDRKCQSFLASTGETQRDFKGVSQKQADVLNSLLHWHTQRNPLCSHKHRQTNSHTWSSCQTYIYNGVEHVHREYKVKTNTQPSIFLFHSPVS